MHQLSNDYQACKLIRLEGDEAKSPFAIVQDAYDPEDGTMRPAFFILQTDGTWIDDLSLSVLPPEAKYNCVFDDVGQVMELLTSLPARPRIQRVPVTQQQIEAHISELKSASLEQRINAMLRKYRAAASEEE